MNPQQQQRSTPCGCCGRGATPASRLQAGRSSWRDKLIARVIARQTSTYNRMVDERKRQLLAPVLDSSRVQDVLEVGMGTGANLTYYAAARKDITLSAVDPNAEMLPYLHATCAEVGFPLQQLSWQQGVAEELPLDDASQDVVIGTLVMCSVTDQRAALAEIHRVLRPGGCYLFLEHVAAPLGSWPRALQELANPLWQRIADGCNMNRETWTAIQSSGFSSVDTSHFQAMNSPLLALLAPHIAGRAVK